MNYRTNSALKYLRALEKSFAGGWIEAYASNQTVYEKLALLHPLHFEEIDLPKHRSVSRIQESIQGTRAFSKALEGNSCEAPLLWGYECELGGALQQDHLFPYSLGGPTIATNRIYLCRYHNLVKFSDIHCYPWEEVDLRTSSWLDFQIKRLYDEVYKLYC